MIIKTWLPIFPGFYNTIFQCEIDSWLLWDNPDDIPDEIQDYVRDIIWDKYNHAEREERVVTLFIDYLNGELKDMGYDARFALERIVHPHEYNFKNDSVNVDLKISTSDWYKLVRDIQDNYLEAFATYIQRNYTSYDGFYSHYSNDPNEWLAWMNAGLENMENTAHVVGAILHFYLSHAGDKDIELSCYYHVAENIYEPEYIDYDDVIAKVNEKFDLNITDLRDLEAE